MKLGEIADAVGLNISTCHHLVGTLTERGYVGQNPRNRNYFLGNRIRQLNAALASHTNIVDLAMPELRRLNQASRETVHLAILQGTDLITLAQIDSPQAVRVGTDAFGKTNAAHATATGKAILAWLPESEIQRVVAAKSMTRFTDRTITDLPTLLEELRHVRRNGHSVDAEEFQEGVTCLGGAIRDQFGAVHGSISCSMPTIRASEEHIAEIKAALRGCIDRLSEKLGGHHTAGDLPRTA